MGINDISKASMEEFREVLNNTDKYILIDFYAFWCEPCVMLNPVIEKIANNYSDTIDVYRVDVDKSSNVADEYKITNVPTLVLQKKEDILANIVGYNSYDGVEKMIQDNINNEIDT